MYAAIFCLCLLMGLDSKENTILLPFTVLLVEWIFFREGRRSAFFRKRSFVWIFFVVAASLLLTFAATNGLFFDFIDKWYATRPFTMIERLMTQPRILLYYLSQVFYPIPSRLSIEHDVVVSSSFLEPWSTVPAILGWRP